MFSGIVEQIAEVVELRKEKSNLHILCKSSITKEFYINQSICHNGVCLTVVDINQEIYTVTAIKETLSKTNLNLLEIGSKINIERCLKIGDRFDGHIVQGHVDQTALCTEIIKEKGSYIFTFEYQNSKHITVEKGSVCINGVSLTVVNSKKNSFSVAIIPYTLEHTNFQQIKLGSIVNIEFDILGKYISKQFK